MIYVIFLSSLWATHYFLSAQIIFVKFAILFPPNKAASPCTLLLTKPTLTKQLKPQVCFNKASVYLVRQKAETMPRSWFSHFQSGQFKLKTAKHQGKSLVRKEENKDFCPKMCTSGIGSYKEPSFKFRNFNLQSETFLNHSCPQQQVISAIEYFRSSQSNCVGHNSCWNSNFS